MSLKVALLFCLVAVALARRPRLGVRLSERFTAARIVGGEDADQGEFPHQISLQYGFSSSYLSHLCGGTIISESWILTAAHCPEAVEGYTMYVKAGKYLLESTEKSEQVRKVSEAFVHEKYPGSVAPYDIALLKLEEPLVFDEYIQPIDLPVSGSDVDGDVILSGWGLTSSYNSDLPNTLQKATLPVIDVETCDAAVESLAGESLVVESNVCTGPLSGGYSACSGDSGGPLIKVEGSSKTIVGIVSWGFVPCGTTGAPSVYTRVSSYIEWIENIIASN